MRIVKESRLKSFADEFPDSADWLKNFARVVKRASWRSIQEVRHVFSHADAVLVESGKITTVFNVKGNEYRLVVAIHYNTGVMYILRFMRHAEYSRGAWKKSL